jgi:uncharacterized protein
MKVLLSPAKSVNEKVEVNGIEKSNPFFTEESSHLVKKLAKLSARQLKKLMKVSDDIANLNFERFQSWDKDQSKFKPAGYLFSGAVYQALDFTSLSSKVQLQGQDKLRILSGLYGVLKPLDLIQPYRLEMGTSLKVTPKVTNLYKYWGDKIRLNLEAELADDPSPILVNTASSEYFKAAQLDKLEAKVITAVFKDKSKDGSYKINMQWAKLARGMMARFILENDVQTADELKAFDVSGYKFIIKESSDSEFIFLRDIPS